MSIVGLLFVAHFFLVHTLAEIVYVGSYTNSISRFDLDEYGNLNYLGDSNSGPSPSWVALSHDKKYLFAVSEIDDYHGQYDGSVASFRIEQDWSMTLISRYLLNYLYIIVILSLIYYACLRCSVSSGGANPAHLSVHLSDSYMYVSNYCSGTIGMIAILPDGSLEDPKIIAHNAKPVSSCDVDGASHVHEVTFSDKDIALVNDLGLNQVFGYEVPDSVMNQEPTEILTSAAVNAGPRHTLVHPFAPFAFVINELDNTMSSYRYNHSSGLLVTELESITTLREGETNEDMAGGEVQISADGLFLYGSNRDNSSPNKGRSSIVVYSINIITGMLTTLQHIYTEGDHPRFFNFFRNGEYMVVANMNSDTIVTFAVDRYTGMLTLSNATITGVTSPTHIVSVSA